MLWGVFCLAMPEEKVPRYVGYGFIAIGLVAMLTWGGQ